MVKSQSPQKKYHSEEYNACMSLKKEEEEERERES
jgi:hypothetical protein